VTGIDSLRNILELERRKGYSDKAVFGGLDKYLHKQAEQIRQSLVQSLNETKRKKLVPQFLTSFDEFNLTNSDYASYDVDERKKWLENIFRFLKQVEKAEEKNELRTRTPGKSNAATTELRQQGQNEGLNLPITVIKGIAPKIASKFAKLNINTVHDLLYFFPRRYVDYSQRKAISELIVGQEQTITGTIWQANITTLGNRKGTEAIIADETGTIRAVWFNQPFLARNFRTNARIAISGTVSEFNRKMGFQSPEWELLENKELLHTGRLVPIYPLTQGLYPKQVRKYTKEAIAGYIRQVSDFLPEEVKTRCQLLDLSTAISQMHYPADQTMAESASKRLAFDELLLLQLGVLAKKRDWQESQPGNAFRVDQEVLDKFLHYLPFSLTQAQKRVLEETLADLKQPKAMSRLLQGDVGSGKTVIATLALLISAANGYQGAFMAPTEILAEQHFASICDYLSKVGTPGCHCEEQSDKAISSERNTLACYSGFLPRPLTIALLVGSLSNNEKANLHDKIKRAEVDIVIGTHALIQKEVEFNKLGLAIIDEQHRFGVLQRSALRQKGFNPHVLVMTATPIPRTMALTLYGDLDLSIIDELPPGRQIVKTKRLEAQYREKAYNFLRREIKNNRQAFIICPLVEESESLEAKAAITEYEYLSREVFPDLKLGLLHGQMHGSEKDAIMRLFRDGEIDILIATSVVEVGIDVPKASVIVVEGAERFGLSQLHQFRGRVGRDKEQGYCILISEKAPHELNERLQLMEKIHDGFVLAEEDLKLRGPGEFFGTHQSGMPDLKVAKLSDLRSLELARQEAITIFQNDPLLRKAKHRLLGQQLRQVWSNNAEWS